MTLGLEGFKIKNSQQFLVVSAVVQLHTIESMRVKCHSVGDQMNREENTEKGTNRGVAYSVLVSQVHWTWYRLKD